MTVDQDALARELRRRAELLDGREARQLADLATLVDTEQHPGELARWLTDVVGTGRNGSAPPGRRLVITPASDLRVERTHWGWRDRIPLGSVTILAGRQGTGKSTAATRLAADASRGKLDGDLAGQVASTLLVTYEDAEATIAARLAAAGADHELVHLLAVEDRGARDLVSVPGDVDLIAGAAQEHGARFLIIDPLMAGLRPGEIDAHRDQDVRHALAPLAQLAEKRELAVLALLHLRKSPGGDALDRLSGSIAFSAAARSVLAFGRPEDADEGAPERVLAVAKSNLAPIAPSLACRIEAASVPGDDGEPVPTSRLVIEGECDTPSSALLQPAAAEDRTSVEVASDWLADYLADGEWHPTAEVQEAARKSSAEIATRTLQRALKGAGVEVDRRGFPAVGMWRLRSRARDDGATGDGATRETGENRSSKPDNGGVGSQSRQDALYGATEGSTLPATAEEEAEAERLRAKWGSS